MSARKSRPDRSSGHPALSHPAAKLDPMTAVITLSDQTSPQGFSAGPSWPTMRPLAPCVYRRRRVVATVVVALLVFCIVLVGSELLGRLSGTPGSTPVGAVGRDVVYVVQPGDTLWEIGLRLNPPGRDIRPFVDRLIDAAGTSVLQPGQRIVLPADW